LGERERKRKVAHKSSSCLSRPIPSPAGTFKRHVVTYCYPNLKQGEEMKGDGTKTQL
jgi:hypothetical protein